MRVIGYVRVSDRDGREGPRFISPTTQRETIERFVKSKGHELVDVVDDIDQPGGKLQRPGLDDVLERLSAGEADAIAVAYLSRLSRQTMDGLTIVERLSQAGQDVLIADLDLDTSTPVGRAVLTVLLAFAQLELDQRRDSWAASQLKALDRGVYSGTTPFGYARDQDGRMVVDPETGPIVRSIFERRANGSSWASLAQWLDTEFPREDGKPWKPAAVRDLLRTPLYLGRIEKVIAGEMRTHEQAHEPLVSRALWESVMHSGARPGPARRGESAMLAGIVRCASCGGAMSRGTGGRKVNAAGERVNYDAYVCTAKCTARAKMSTTTADAFVLERFIERLAASRSVGAARRSTDRIAAAERELERAETERDVYLSAISAADVGAAAFAQGARERAERVDEKRRALAETAARERGPGLSYADLLDRLPTMGDGERNVQLRRFVGRVVITKSGQPGRGGRPEERIRIVWSGGDEATKDDLGVGEDVLGERQAVAA